MSKAPTCPECGATDEIWGIEVRGVYDGVLYWRCMACGKAFNRWPENHHLWQVAEDEIKEAANG